jgi:TolB protein
MTAPRPSDVRLSPRRLGDGQSSIVHRYNVADMESIEVHRTDEILLEAPNWVGEDLLLNGAGSLWRLSTSTDAPTAEPVSLAGVPDLNNDHVVASDGDTVYVSAYDWHIYRASLSSGEAVRVTQEAPDRPMMHFLHGLSPDGEELAFIGLEPDESAAWSRANVFTMPTGGGSLRQLTFDSRPADGCEYSPDGEWIYFNTEAFSQLSGHAQLARIRPDGTELTQLTFDDRVNWFPHVSPDGIQLAYLSYEPGTQGHPADRRIKLRCAPVEDVTAATTVADVFGGQGTLNVNSWSADSTSFAYVTYTRGRWAEPVGL